MSRFPWLSAHPRVKAALAWLLPGGLLGWITFTQKIPELALGLMRRLTRVEAGATVLGEAAPIAINVVFVACVIGVTVAVLWARKEFWGKLNQRIQTFYLDPASRLYSLFLEAPSALYSRIEWEFIVQPDFCGVTTMRFSWSAVSAPIIAKGHERGCSVPVEGLESVGLTATVIEGVGDVLVLPAEDSAQRKRYLVFPVPALQPGATPQRVQITGRWPRMFEKLKAKGAWDYHDFKLPPNHPGPIDQVTIRFIMGSSNYKVEFQEEFRPTSRSFDGTTYEVALRDVNPGTRIAVKVRRVT